MKTHALIFTLALLASCGGQCNYVDAAAEVLGPAAECTTGGGRGVCFVGQAVFACGFTGTFSYEARCTRIGTFTPLQPQVEVP